jgi:predicted transglutaminase-like cysteine proteinase
LIPCFVASWCIEALASVLGQDLPGDNIGREAHAVNQALCDPMRRALHVRRSGVWGPWISRGWLLSALLVLGAALAVEFDTMLRLARDRYGAKAVQTVQSWQRMVESSADLPDEDKLEAVNTFFNRRTLFQEDPVVWQQQDYWASPLEFMGRAAGDCEDYAISKYVTLLNMGVPRDKLRLIYVKARSGGASVAHMVLGYYPNPAEEPMILDNLIGSIRMASQRGDLSPVFSFNADGLWVGGAARSSADPTSRLSRWRDVLDRMRQEGL